MIFLDFSCFCKNTAEVDNKTCNVFLSYWKESDELLTFNIKANINLNIYTNININININTIPARGPQTAYFF